MIDKTEIHDYKEEGQYGERAGGCGKPAQVVITDCEEGLKEEQERENQRMRDERGLSLCDLLHSDGVYLPRLLQ